MVRLAVSCVAILFPLFAMADYTNTGVQIECLTSKNEVRFSAQTLTSEPALWAAAPEGERARFLRDARARNFYLEGAFDHSCKLRGAEVRVWGEIFEPSERGECGADPGGKIYMSINGISVLHFMNIGNGCFPSLWRAALSIRHGSAGEPARLVLCGFDRFGVWSGKEPKCATRSAPLAPPANGKPRQPFYQDEIERIVGAG